MLWKAPDFNENIFLKPSNLKIPDFAYTNHEITNFIDYLSWFHADIPIGKSIVPLLYSTQNFNASIAPDLDYSAMRDRSRTDEEIDVILNEMLDKLNRAKETLKKEPKDSISYKLLATAIQYCCKSLLKNLEAIPHQGKFYTRYKDSRLRSLLEDKSFVTG